MFFIAPSSAAKAACRERSNCVWTAIALAARGSSFSFSSSSGKTISGLPWASANSRASAALTTNH
jgi:hypothetical protein